MKQPTMKIHGDCPLNSWDCPLRPLYPKCMGDYFPSDFDVTCSLFRDFLSRKCPIMNRAKTEPTETPTMIIIFVVILFFSLLRSSQSSMRRDPAKVHLIVKF